MRPCSASGRGSRPGSRRTPRVARCASTSSVRRATGSSAAASRPTSTAALGCRPPLTGQREHQVELNATEREFLEASREATQREVENERRTNRRLRGLLAGAGVLLFVALAAGGFALTQADSARQQAELAGQRQAEAEAARGEAVAAARFARSRELAASAVSVIDEDPTLSKMLAVAAANIDASGLDIDSALRRSWAADRQLARWTPPTDGPVDLILTSLHPDGRHMAVVTDLGPRDRLSVVDVRDGTTRWPYEPELPQAALSRAFFSSDGARVVVATVWAPDDDEKGVAPPADALGLLVFDTETGRLIERVDTGPCGVDLWEAAGGVGLVRTVPDDPELATDCFNNVFDAPLEAVDLTTGERTLLTETPWDPVALSADGRFAAFTDDSDRRSYVVDLRTGERVMSLPVSDELGQRDSYVRALSADGSLLLYGDRPPKVYAVPSGKEVAALDQGAGEHFGASFAPTGTLAYLSGRDASLSAWDAATGTLVFRSTAAGGGTPVANATGQVLIDDTTSKTVGLFEGAARGEAGAVDTCRGLTFGGQLEINGDVAAYTTDCELGPTTLFMIDVPSLSVRRDLGGRRRPGHRPRPGWPARGLRVDHRRHRAAHPHHRHRNGPSAGHLRGPLCMADRRTRPTRRGRDRLSALPASPVPALAAAYGVLARWDHGRVDARWWWAGRLGCRHRPSVDRAGSSRGLQP